MKNIKFRAWDDVNNRMVYDFSKESQFKTKEGCYSCGISADKNVITASLSLQKHDDFAFRHVKYIELMQYTGLKDKNGVEIYEGDYVVGMQYLTTSPNVPFEIRGVVRYSERNTMFYIGDKDKGHDMFMQSLGSIPYILEIIGNIYENPDLLEV